MVYSSWFPSSFQCITLRNCNIHIHKFLTFLGQLCNRGDNAVRFDDTEFWMAVRWHFPFKNYSNTQFTPFFSIREEIFFKILILKCILVQFKSFKTLPCLRKRLMWISSEPFPLGDQPRNGQKTARTYRWVPIEAISTECGTWDDLYKFGIILQISHWWVNGYRFCVALISMFPYGSRRVHKNVLATIPCSTWHNSSKIAFENDSQMGREKLRIQLIYDDKMCRVMKVIYIWTLPRN